MTPRTLIYLLLIATNWQAYAQDTLNVGQTSTDRINELEAKIDSLRSGLDSLNGNVNESVTPYNVSIGASFDFLDGLRASDIYAEVSIGLYNSWGNKGIISNQHQSETLDRKTKRWGLDLGFSQSRSLSGMDYVKRRNSRDRI